MVWPAHGVRILGRISTAEQDLALRLSRPFRAGQTAARGVLPVVGLGHQRNIVSNQEFDESTPPIRRRIHRAQGQHRRYEFPSGHVINYIGVYGTLAVILSHRIRSALVRRVVVAFVAIKIALVGPSRIYLGHHWFTDVLASYLLGSSYIIVLTSLYKRALRKG